MAGRGGLGRGGAGRGGKKSRRRRRDAAGTEKAGKAVTTSKGDETEDQRKNTRCGGAPRDNARDAEAEAEAASAVHAEAASAVLAEA